MTRNNAFYDSLINRHIDHLSREYDQQSIDGGASQLWCLTFTFPTQTEKALSLHGCFARVERWYVRLLPRLISNFDRKRHLQPLMYAYADHPSSKRKKPYASLSLVQKLEANGSRNSFSHPETDLHIHAVIAVPAPLAARALTVSSKEP